MNASDELAQRMFEKARGDLRALKNMLDPDAFTDEIVGFHAQQAVEKALKAWLAALDHGFPFTHDLAKLLHELENHDQAVERFWPLLDLSLYAVHLRYEYDPGMEEPIDRAALAHDVSELLDHVEPYLANRPKDSSHGPTEHNCH